MSTCFLCQKHCDPSKEKLVYRGFHDYPFGHSLFVDLVLILCEKCGSNVPVTNFLDLCIVIPEQRELTKRIASTMDEHRGRLLSLLKNKRPKKKTPSRKTP